MDPNWKCLSWVGSICQKIEEIFPTEEDIVFQESFEYVHNQIQAAGANVKQFCSELVDDVFNQSSTSPLGESAHDPSTIHKIDTLACENNMPKNSEVVELESAAGEILKPCLEQIVAIGNTNAGGESSSSMKSLSSNHHDREIKNNEAPISCPVTVNLTGSITLMKDEETENDQVDSSATTISNADKTVDCELSPLIDGGLSKALIDTSTDSTSEEGADSLASIKMKTKTIHLADERFIMLDAKLLYDKIKESQDLKKPAANERRRVQILRRPARRRHEYLCHREIEAESQIRGGNFFTKPSNITAAADDEYVRHGENEAESQIHGGKSFAKPSHITTAEDDEFSDSEWEIIENDNLIMD